MSVELPSVKAQVHRIWEMLSDDATWDDVLYQVDLRASIARGLEDARAGRVHSLSEVRERVGLPPLDEPGDN